MGEAESKNGRRAHTTWIVLGRRGNDFLDQRMLSGIRRLSTLAAPMLASGLILHLTRVTVYALTTFNDNIPQDSTCRANKE